MDNLQIPVLEISTAYNRPAIRMRRGEVFSVNRTALLLLGKPHYLQFYWGERERILMLAVGDPATGCTYKIGEYYYTYENRARIKGGAFIRAIQRRTGWDNSAVYRCKGEYIASLNMVAFRLENAEKEAAV